MRNKSLCAMLAFSMIGCIARWPAPDFTMPLDQNQIIDSHDQLASLSDDFWQDLLHTSPTFATFLGDRRFDSELPDISEAALASNHEKHIEMLDRLHHVDRSKLNLQEQFSVDVLEHELTSRIESFPCKTWLWSVDQLDGPQVTFAELPNHHTIRTIDDAKNLIARYRKMKAYYAQHIANLKRGQKLGFTSPRIIIEEVISQLNWQLKQAPAKSPYAEATRYLPDVLTSDQQKEIRHDMVKAIKEDIYPALSQYRDFLRNDLLATARKKVGVNTLPGGSSCYQSLIFLHTGLRKSADEIHQLGLEEVARIKHQMTLLAKNDKNVSLRTYIKQLRQKRQNYVSSRNELLAYNQKLVAKAQAALPRAFGRLPSTPIEVKSIENFREREAPAAYYYEAPIDATRPAFYYLNTYQPNKRPLYNMAVLAFHEALPGHHLQIALANENQNLPEFQRQIGQTAFVEGWALYAENLAGELGLYETPAEKLGALNYELWRALRLVVDTGLHHKNWTRKKAVHYLAHETALTEMEVTNEIDRYITWPAQALAYKIGQIEIANARKAAENRLGQRFSLTSFHDRLLYFGALPLLSMRRNIDAWVKEQEISSTNSGFVLMP